MLPSFRMRSITLASRQRCAAAAQSPLTFGHLQVNPEDCAIIEFPVGNLRIITPTQSVMDRLAAAYAWKDAQSRDQAIMVAANQQIDWDALQSWFANEGESDEEFRRFKDSVRER